EGEKLTDTVNLIEEIDDELTIRQLVSNVRETVAQSYRYQNYPLQVISDERELELKTRTNVLVYSPQLHHPPEALEQYDLVIQVLKDEFAMRVRLGYNPQHFDRSYI